MILFLLLWLGGELISVINIYIFNPDAINHWAYQDNVVFQLYLGRIIYELFGNSLYEELFFRV